MELGKPKFEHSALEKEIQRLSQEIKDHKGSGGQMPEKDLVKSLLQSRIQPSIMEPAAKNPAPVSDILPEYLQKESPEIQLKVEELVDMAFHKGIEASVKEAKKYGPFILDALHDSLTSKIYDELKSRKLL
ncbi:MAG: hypothetical protein Q7S73_02370 [bacterium]|nr:hypothetical protein [bacterium]